MTEKTKDLEFLDWVKTILFALIIAFFIKIKIFGTFVIFVYNYKMKEV